MKIIDMKPIYEVGQSLAFIARSKCVYNGNRISGRWMHFVGYVKQVRRSLLGVRYVMNVSKSSEVYIVPQRDIMGIVNNRTKSDENGSDR